MPLRTLVVAAGMIVAAGGALFLPILGVMGYILNYNLGIERQWWGRDFREAGVRMSLGLAAATLVGMVLNSGRLRSAGAWLLGHEKLVLAFLCVAWLSVPLGQGMRDSAAIDHPAIKLTKVIIFALMMTHVAIRLKDLNWLMWTLAAGAAILGLEAWDTPRSMYVAGRLETVGGPDFADSNALAAYIAAMLPFMYVLLIRSGWLGRIFIALGGAFAINAIVLCRSRGTVVALAVGAVAMLIFAPAKRRLRTALGVLLGLAALVYLGDPGFWSRAGTLGSSTEQMDVSAQIRFEIWRGGMKMFADHPLGVGAGNFSANIGRYVPALPDRDAHNTFIRCFCELGVQGGLLLVVVIVSAFRACVQVLRRSGSLPPESKEHLSWLARGLFVSMVIYITAGFAGTLLYNEGFWWLLVLPVCMLRACENTLADQEPAPVRIASKPRKSRLQEAPR